MGAITEAVAERPRLAFVVPLKGRAACRDWAATGAMLQRCLESIRRQDTREGFETILVCNELPEGIDPRRMNLHVVQVPDSGPVTVEERRSDKRRKLAAGIARARELDSTHVMAVDADDVVSRRITAFVERQHAASPGWYGSTGFIRREGHWLAFRSRDNFQNRCGTSTVVRIDLQSQRLHPNHFAHQQIQFGAERLQPLPFSVAVYSVSNGENLNATTLLAGRGTASPARFAKLVLRYVPTAVTPRFRREFALPADDRVVRVSAPVFLAGPHRHQPEEVAIAHG